MHNTTLVDLINDYKKVSNDFNFNKIIVKLNPLINEYLVKIPNTDRNDIKQEFLVEIFKKISNSNIHYLYLNKSLFTYKNYKVIEQSNFSKKTINIVFNNKYVYNILKKYCKSEIKDIFINKFKRDEFIKMFANYSANNSFYKLIKISFRSIIAKYYRKKRNDIISLNNINKQNIEYINIISNANKEYYFDWEIFDKEDREFLLKFIDGNKMLSQADLAKELNITQQAVSKKIVKIREKYKNKKIFTF